MDANAPQRSIERRQATVMFADVTGFTALVDAHGAERAYATLTDCLRALDGIARRHGGAVDKYLGDALMAVFGYPVPLRDAPGAAVAAALEMQSRLADLNRELGGTVPLGLYVGINTGSMIAGDLTGPVIREFHVLGDAVNTAARIKSKAPVGRVYVGPETHAATCDRFVYQALAPMTMKGKAEPVPVFEVQGLRRGGRSGIDVDRVTGPIVGRDAELARLRRAAERLAEGRGGVVVVTGAEGLGKSRLIAELLASKEAEGAARREDAAFAVGREQPLQMFATPGEPETREAVAARIGSALRAQAAERPTIYVLEDLHWADPASLGVVEALLPLASELPVLFLLSWRPDAPDACTRLATARAEQAREIIELAPLSPSAAERLVAELAWEKDLDDATRRLILERGAGNPFHLGMGVFLSGALVSQAARAEAMADRSSETERRRSTVLFADITGFTSMSERMPPEDAYPIVAGCLALLDQIARRHGGTVDKYLGDCVLALFGVPKAIEDSPRAAANAAIEMVQAVRRYSEEHALAHPLDVHIGIHTGLGIAGDVSGPLIREFAVMGDPVSIASALCDYADGGEIFVGPETWRYTESDFEYRSVAPLLRKQNAEPVPTHELVSRTQRLHRARLGAERRIFSNLVGREPELDALKAALERLAAGEGGVVTLVAEAGVGKSRLVAELAGSPAAAAVAWREGRCLSTGQQLSFHPFADLVRSWAGITDQYREITARAKLEAETTALLGDDASESFPFLASLMGVPLTDQERERIARIQGEAVEKLIRAGVTRLLRAGAAIAPICLVLDDLHWADQSSIELLESLLRLCEEAPILFLHVSRPGFPATSERIRGYVREHHAGRHVELELRPLDAGAARRLVKNLFREGDVPQVTRAMIEEKAQGNPFYIEEVVRSLVDQGAVEVLDGRFVATARIHAAEIPGTIQEVVMARVDRLPLKRRQLLQVASVVGQSFHRDVLAAIQGDETRLETDLEALLETEFLVASDRLAGLEYAFKHPLLQEVTYDGLVQTRREELHRAVAEAIESRLSQDLPGYEAMLAFHFSKGRVPERAEEYLFRAGDEAARVAASSEALHFFREASKLYFELHGDGGDPAKKARIEKNVALALLNRGDMLDAVEHFDRAAEYLGARISRKPLAMATRFAWNLTTVLGAVYLPRTRGRRPAATETQKEVFDLMFRRAIAQSTAAPTRFLSDCMDLLRALSRVDPTTVPEAAAMYSGASSIFSYSGLSFSVSRRFLGIARELAEAGAVDQRVLYWRALGYLHDLLEGNWGPEHDVQPEAIEAGLREGWFWEAGSLVNWECMKLLCRGDWTAVRERTLRMTKIADLYQHELTGQAAQATTAYLHVERRELPEALAALEIYYDEARTPVLNLNALGVRAKVEIFQGDLERAARTLAKADAVLAEAGRAAPYHAANYRLAHFHLAVAQLADAQAQADPGRVHAARDRVKATRKPALATAAKVAYRVPEALRLDARASWLMHRRNDALGAWSRAIARCEALGARPELARTWEDAGIAIAEWRDGPGALAGRSASELIEAARALYRELTLTGDLARLNQRTG